ncbi:hypothetical protein GCM10009753_60950 [Streptantibioticus ferralitis]
MQHVEMIDAARWDPPDDGPDEPSTGLNPLPAAWRAPAPARSPQQPTQNRKDTQ